MAVLYLTEQGSRLNREGERLILTKEGEILAEFPARLVEAIYIFGNISPTAPVIRYMLLNGIEGVFLPQEGRYFGRLISEDSRFGLLRQRQYLALADSGLRLKVAQAIVAGKIQNQQRMLQSHGFPSFVLHSLIMLAEDALSAPSHERLLGIEGQASALYYDLYRQIFQQDLGFRKRTRRPPKDPVKGFLHTTHYSRPSLALDLIEEFRPMIDDLVLRVVNSQRYQLGDFRRSEEDPSAVLLTDEARKRFLGDLETLMNQGIPYPGQARLVTVRRALELQARQIAHIVLGHKREYQPLSLSSS